jgi:hypothetical protein
MADKARLDPTLVHDFVGVAHGDLDRTRELIGQEPALVNAAWDWGGGDWETGLGAATHVGRRDIALFLLGHGARMDIFAAAMLGHLEHRPRHDRCGAGGTQLARAARHSAVDPRRGRQCGGGRGVLARAWGRVVRAARHANHRSQCRCRVLGEESRIGWPAVARRRMQSSRLGTGRTGPGLAWRAFSPSQ